MYGRYRGAGSAQVVMGAQKATVVFGRELHKRNVASALWVPTKSRHYPVTRRTAPRDGALDALRSAVQVDIVAGDSKRRTGRRFKKQMIASDRNAAAKGYAQAIARGDGRDARGKKLLVARLTKQLNAIEHDYSSNEELQPLSNYLNDELKSARRALVAARYGGATPTQMRQWNGWVANLRRAGAKDGGTGVEMPVYMLEDELRIASRLLAIEVEAGRGDKDHARALNKRLVELGNTRMAREYGWSKDTFADEQVQQRAESLAMEIAASKLSDAPDAARAENAQIRLERLTKYFHGDSKEYVQTAVQNFAGTRVQPLTTEIAEQEAEHKPTPKQPQLARIAKAMGTSTEELMKPARSTVVRQDYNATTDQLVNEVLAGREDGEKAKKLTAEVGALKQKSEDPWQVDAIQRAYSGRGHQLAYELESALANRQPDDDAVANLQDRLNDVAKIAGKDAKAFRDWEKTRVDAKQGPVNIEDYRFKVAGLDPNDFHGGYGVGDPLIAIEAPQDAQSVVAVMPDGSVKPLEWRAEHKRWEANFDIPTYATNGDYLVSVIIVQKDGTRRTLSVRYRVDAEAPTGTAKLLATGGGNARLEIGASDDTTRVTALLPWGERQVLRRDGTTALFASTLNVPAEWRARKFVVRFVLLDRAHNRTELLVDWN